jgi:hypothetical protein
MTEVRTEPMRAAGAREGRLGARTARHALAVLLAVSLAACVGQPSPTPTPSLPSTATPSPAPPSAVASASPSSAPTATPEPPLSLDLPAERDRHRVSVEVAPEVPADGNGRIVVTVRNESGSRVDELVLRWPSELGRTLYLAPFEPSQQRIAEGGPPLWQEWTKWVLGPGERGEPAGTISLGWGPLLAGGTLTIPILVTRQAPGAVAFDLQLLAGEKILTLDRGGPAELRVSVP